MNKFAIAGIISSSLTSIGFAGYMAINLIQGWGWFLFVGFLIAGGLIERINKL